LRRGKCVIAVIAQQKIETSLKVSRTQERGGGIDATDRIGRWAIRCAPLDRMSYHGNGSGRIIREFRWPHEGHIGTRLPRHACDLFVVGRDDDAIETFARLRRLDGPCNHRLSAERLDVLARNALAAAPRW